MVPSLLLVGFGWAKHVAGQVLFACFQSLKDDRGDGRHAGSGIVLRFNGLSGFENIVFSLFMRQLCWAIWGSAEASNATAREVGIPEQRAISIKSASAASGLSVTFSENAGV
jgi:hypothetical protein